MTWVFLGSTITFLACWISAFLRAERLVKERDEWREYGKSQCGAVSLLVAERDEAREHGRNAVKIIVEAQVRAERAESALRAFYRAKRR